MGILFKPAALKSTLIYLAICFFATMSFQGYALGKLGPIGAWILSVNIVLVTVMAKDKLSAIVNFGRTPEGTLLWLAAAGGYPGLFIARFIFNHKTTKPEFVKPMWMLLILQVGAILYYFVVLDQSF
jgi:uncharacterized membrane protein YsdA (DUF1294 family)|tara:strand:- start:107 stop:487 length:381 start_codon:yes stop_codon:yes gene_type:complete